MLIKASSISNLTDARYFAAKEVNWLGFQIEEAMEDFVHPTRLKEIREWVAGPKICGEFYEFTADEVIEAANFYNLDTVQVTSTQLFEMPENPKVEVILKLNMGDNFFPIGFEETLAQNRSRIHYFLLDFAKAVEPEAGFLGNSKFWKRMSEQFPLIFQCNFSPALLPDFLEEFRPAGLGLRGGSEEKIGVKSFDDLDEIFEILTP